MEEAKRRWDITKHWRETEGANTILQVSSCDNGDDDGDYGGGDSDDDDCDFDNY